MKSSTFAILSVAMLAACTSKTQSNTAAEDENTTAAATANTSVNAGDSAAASLPPTVLSSAAYRCSDGKALYVDILSDKQSVTVRDSRRDTPTLLKRDGRRGPFTGDGRTLSGTGSSEKYSSQTRTNQTCTKAPS